MSPALNGSSAIRRFECGNAVEISDGIAFNFYTGLPHTYVYTMVLTGGPGSPSGPSTPSSPGAPGEPAGPG